MSLLNLCTLPKVKCPVWNISKIILSISQIKYRFNHFEKQKDIDSLKKKKKMWIQACINKTKEYRLFQSLRLSKTEKTNIWGILQIIFEHIINCIRLNKKTWACVLWAQRWDAVTGNGITVIVRMATEEPKIHSLSYSSSFSLAQDWKKL